MQGLNVVTSLRRVEAGETVSIAVYGGFVRRTLDEPAVVLTAEDGTDLVVPQVIWAGLRLALSHA